MVEYIKKKILKDGTVKIYSYDKSAGFYYHKKKEEMKDYKCERCERKINYDNKARHWKSKKCIEINQLLYSSRTAEILNLPLKQN